MEVALHTEAEACELVISQRGYRRRQRTGMSSYSVDHPLQHRHIAIVGLVGTEGSDDAPLLLALHDGDGQGNRGLIQAEFVGFVRTRARVRTDVVKEHVPEGRNLHHQLAALYGSSGEDASAAGRAPADVDRIGTCKGRRKG